jgi:hypothetical protein
MEELNVLPTVSRDALEAILVRIRHNVERMYQSPENRDKKGAIVFVVLCCFGMRKKVRRKKVK